MNSLKGKIALVTGGASGIGAATARMFRDAGATVALLDKQDASALAAELGGSFHECDVTDAAAVEATVQKVVAEHGRLDVLFNNAGIERHAPVAVMEPEVHDLVMRVDADGVFYCLQSAIRAMVSNDGPNRGSIINTASVAGLMGSPGMASYGAAKAAVVSMTKYAALEVAGFGVRVNAVCPGIIRTPMADAFTEQLGNTVTIDEICARAHPIGRTGEPEDVAKLVTFLASDDSSFITGTAIPIDGGMTAGVSPQQTEGLTD